MTKYFFNEDKYEVRRVLPDRSIKYRDWENGYISGIRDSFGGTTKISHDLHGNPITLQRPGDQEATQTEYDQDFNVPIRVIPPVGAMTLYSLDPNTGDVLQMTRGGLTVSYTRDRFGKLLSVNNGLATYSNQRDANGFLTRVFDLHNPELRSYDSRGRLSTRQFQSGRLVSYSYDDYDQVLTVTDSHGPTVTNTYDAMERLVKRVESAGGVSKVTTYRFDDRDRLVSTTDPLGRVTAFGYDPVHVREKPSSITDSAGRTQFFAYDENDRIVQMENAVGAVTKFTYDQSGNLTSVTDALGNVTTYSYDKNNRKIRESRPSVAGTHSARREQLYFYDGADHLVKELTRSATGGQNRAIVNSFDPLDRIVNRVVRRESASGVVVEDESTFQYSNQLDATLLQSAVNGVASLGFASEAVPPFALTGYSMNASQAGNPLGLIEGNFEISRDVTGEIRALSKDGASVFHKTYDPAGRMLSGTMGSGSTTIGYGGFARKTSVVHSDGSSASFQRDLLDRLTHVAWSGATPVSESLTYDLAGNVTQVQRENGTSNISYDAVDQLMSSTGLYSKTFAYDLLGNRLQDSANGPGSFVSNFLTSNGTSSFIADPDGFGDVVREVSGGVTKNYLFRSDDRMIGYSDGTNQVAYYYDGLGRRVAKVISGLAGNFTQSFLHLGTQDQVLMAKAGDGSLIVYLDGQSPDEHLAEVRNGVFKGFVTDHLGSILNDDAAGAIHGFGLFGEPVGSVALSPSSNPVMYGFSGREFEPESRLNYHRARTYNPAVGRWLSQEPTGMDGPNLYWAMRNNPLKYTDPTGLNSRIVTQGGHEVVEVDDPDHPGQVISIGMGPDHSKSTTMDVVKGPVPGRVDISPGRAWGGVKIPGTEITQSVDEDRYILQQARMLQQAYQSGDLQYDALGFNLKGNATNCAGFAYDLQHSGGK